MFCLLSLLRAAPHKFSSHRAKLLESLQERQKTLTGPEHEVRVVYEGVVMVM